MTHVTVETKKGNVVFDGFIIKDWLEDGSSCLLVKNALGEHKVVSERYYNIVESEDDAKDVPSGMSQQATSAPVPPMPVKAKPKETLNDGDIERVISKVSDVTLSTLKSIGLKSGELYPIMIKINDALRVTLSQQKENNDG